jgi:hypothetical protein
MVFRHITALDHEALEEIAQIVTTGRTIVVIGAGVSRSSGIPVRKMRSCFEHEFELADTAPGLPLAWWRSVKEGERVDGSVGYTYTGSKRSEED